MNTTFQQKKITFDFSYLALIIIVCNEQDQYKLLFLEQSLSNNSVSPRDILQWLNLQDIYFTAHFTYNHKNTFLKNISAWIKYKKYSHIYPVTWTAKQKRESSDSLILEIKEITNCNNKLDTLH